MTLKARSAPSSWAGKSTLLNLIAGIDKPSGGTIEIGGVDIATLGEGAASIHVNQMRLAGTRRQAAALGVLSAQGVQVHTLTQADGSTVRQYVSADGRVYAVAWNTRYKPRLSELLGTHFSAYAQAGRRAMQQRPGVLHQARLQQGDLVVESAAHLNAFVGRAYLRSRLPAATAPDAIR